MSNAFLISEALAADSQNQASATAAAGTTADAAPYELSAEKMMMDNLMILVMLFGIFYFILIRPQQKRVRMHQEMMKNLQKGNKVMTTGGIIGTIVKFEGDDVAVVEIAQNVKVRVARGSVSEVLDDKSSDVANDN
jgi:preprotein translocase subunit YajC